MKRLRIDKQERFDMFMPFLDDEQGHIVLEDDVYADLMETIRKWEAWQDRLYIMEREYPTT
jgi:hypothetical protein